MGSLLVYKIPFSLIINFCIIPMEKGYALFSKEKQIPEDVLSQSSFIVRHQALEGITDVGWELQSIWVLSTILPSKWLSVSFGS